MIQRRQNTQYQYAGSSKLAAIRVDDIDNSLEVSPGSRPDPVQWFGNYTSTGETPIILIPERSSCAPYVYV